MKVVQNTVVGFMVFVACASAVSGGTMGIASTAEGGQPLTVDWSRLSIAGSYQFQHREVWAEDGVPGKLDMRQALAHVGLDVCSWLTLTAAVGTGDTRIGNRASYDDRVTVYGCGLRSRLLGREVTGFDSRAGKWVVQAEAQYLYHDADSPEMKMDWDELSANLQLRYEQFIFGMGEDPDRYPYSAAFYVGPTWSHFDGDLDARHHAGVIAGIDVMMTRRLAVGAELQFYEEPSTAFKVGYHF